MSDFSLEFNRLDGTIHKLRAISNSLSSAQDQTNAQAGRLSGMSVFGILRIQAAINNVGQDLARMGVDTNAIATFVDELQRIVVEEENKVLTALDGEVDAFSSK